MLQRFDNLDVKMSHRHWSKTPIKSILLDINGVLYDSGEDHPIEGSVEAMKRLVVNGYKFCLVTNECTTAKSELAKKLNNFGFDCIDESKIVSPAPVACSYLTEHNLIPRLHVYDGVLKDFKPILDKQQRAKLNDDNNTKIQPNCLVIGDIMDKMSRDFMDESLEIMLNCREKIQILSLGAGRYYKDAGRLRMDTGAYVSAFEFCLGVKAINVGKPTGAFFNEALKVVGSSIDETIMIGDDIVSDVGGAQQVGMRGFLVRTGKYKKTDETERGVTPDDVFDNLNQAIDILIKETNR